MAPWWPNGVLFSRVVTKGRGAGESPPLPSPLSLFRSFSVSPLPKFNMAPRQTFHRNLRGASATQAKPLPNNAYVIMTYLDLLLISLPLLFKLCIYVHNVICTVQEQLTVIKFTGIEFEHVTGVQHKRTCRITRLILNRLRNNKMICSSYSTLNFCKWTSQF